LLSLVDQEITYLGVKLSKEVG